MEHDVVRQQQTTVLLTGAGSGGHITPILAVATELKRRDSSFRTLYVGQRGDNLGDIPAAHDAIDEVRVVSCGKLRRYHGHGLRQLLDVKTLALNLRDAFKTALGILQSIWLVWRAKPSVAFIKGGFVGVPVGLACALLRVPYITHDSDALPGLANRLIAPWASLHTVSLPKSTYRYPHEKMEVVGVPISENYGLVETALKNKCRDQLGIGHRDTVLFVSGGGLGAQRLNAAIVSSAQELFAEYSSLWVLHQGGRANAKALEKEYLNKLGETKLNHVRVLGFAADLYIYSAAADLVVTRAGGTTLAELAAQGKPCIVVPNPDLTGGHQSKNAAVLQESGAVEVVSEKEIVSSGGDALKNAILGLLHDHLRRESLSTNFHLLARPDATERIAGIIIDSVSVTQRKSIG